MSTEQLLVVHREIFDEFAVLSLCIVKPFSSSYTHILLCIVQVCTDWLGRDPVTHELQQNLTLWPGGMKSFADWLHAHGMQVGDEKLKGRSVGFRHEA